MSEEKFYELYHELHIIELREISKQKKGYSRSTYTIIIAKLTPIYRTYRTFMN